ncbi:capsular polysaccharide biosynthesis protein [Streptococcus pneumoniae]|nr:capsular polysaccharide biosynthesis protein [Streptococcus pneumoniae]
MPNYNIPFSPPDITEAEIAEVADTLRSGWITTGPKTKELERRLSLYTQTPKIVCLNSATAALELILRVLEVGPGDEVIVPAMTYTASVVSLRTWEQPLSWWISKQIRLRWTMTCLSKLSLRKLR